MSVPWWVFVRQKKNKSGVVSIQVIDKSHGKYKVCQTIGSSGIPEEIAQMVEEGKAYIMRQTGLQEFDFMDYDFHTQLILKGLEQITVVGPEILLGKIFNEIGFNQVKDEVFRQLVLARLCFPASKLKTTDYLSKYQYLDIDVQVIYRYLDKLYNHQKNQVQEISYNHTLKILGHQISLVFYDVTTIYFESESEDDLRRTGYSKDGKHQHPQIVLGLLVSKGGYPLAYDIFEGNKFEGHTMLPIINSFKMKYKLENLVVVADAGLLSNDNLGKLREAGYEFILGARIKAETQALREKILELNLMNGQSASIAKDENTRLIINFSEARARKDAHNRERGIEKLKKLIKSGEVTKANINNRGYNKFLKMKSKVKVSLDKEKINQDKQWDGLKGYVTNTSLTTEEVIENYKDLWQIEKAFRIAKTDLQIRPIYHRVQRRIEAHICIAFAAYKIYKELERQLREKQTNLTPEKAISIAKTIYGVVIRHPITKAVTTHTYIKTNQQQELAKLFNF